jgi:amino acid adenylation domain-containing protein
MRSDRVAHHGDAGNAASLVDVLRSRAAREPDSAVFSFPVDGEDGAEVVLTAGEFNLRAQALATRLQELGLTGERALLLFSPGLEFIVAFFGCLYARVVAVPAHVPRPNRPMPRLRSIVGDARPSVVLTGASLRKDSARWSAGVPELEGVAILCSDEWTGEGTGDDFAARKRVEECASRWTDPGATQETLAFLQYTSGSTAAPRGVMITHGNLLDNSARIHAAFESPVGGRGVSWLPLFHDMGLIGGVIQPLYCGGFTTLLSPASFLQRPIRWLETISRTGASISGGPNFAYDLCVEKTTPEQRAGLDLSRWRVAFNGAEPVRAETLDRFAEAFAPAGFRPEAFLPCYGLAEATLLVSGNPTGSRPVVLSLDAEALGRGEVGETGAVGSIARLVSSGRPTEDHTVTIVDPATEQPCPDNRVGEIWVAGPSVAQGYWNRPEESRLCMGARLPGHGNRAFLRTGDLGFLHGGELFVTGRIKDLIILRGRNIYPQDVEWVTERCHPALRAGGGAAFSVEVAGLERLAVVIETERRLQAGAADEIMAAIRRAVAETLDVEISAIRLIKPTTLPRTSSGKVQRHATREAFLSGTLETVAEWTRHENGSVPAPAFQSAAFEPDEDVPGTPPATTASRPSVPSRSRRAIAAWLAAKVAEPLGVPPEEVDIRAPLAGFGIGSLQAVRLAAELEDWLGRKLPPTLVYDHPTILALAGFLSGESPDGAAMPTERQRGATGREPIAIVGIGCRFPGASGPAAFWDLLRNGIEAIGEVPDSRWTEQDLRGLDFPRRSGFLRDIDRFDAAFFDITRREAMFLDPQHRMLLEIAWEALEDAGQSPDRLAGMPVGVFIGISTNDYAFIQVKRGGAAIGHRVTGNSGSIAANRISHFFDFRGPSLAVDTACSSSLVSTLMACRSLWDGESDIALAGGSNLLLQTQVFAGFAKSGFLSPDGHCRAFDAGANGYVRGEGAGIVVLKPLSRAIADGDAIYAIIRGGAMNQDGRTNGLTAPSGPAQEAVLRAAYRHADVLPGQVDYIEAHGTGTPLGDPIELLALGAVLSEGRGPARRCALGSVKTNIGHLEAAAGVAGLIKTALSLHHRTIPATLNFSRPNPHVDLDTLPVRIVSALESWPASAEPARAGVSAFGFGGTNAHLILEEAPRHHAVGPARSGSEGPNDEDVVIPLSARTPEALFDVCRSFRDFLADAPDEVNLRDVAYSAGARRAHLEHRLALVVAGRDEALGSLDAYFRGEPHMSVMIGRRHPGLRTPPVFVFSDGRGIRLTAVRQLCQREPVFRAAIERCEMTIGPAIGCSLVSILDGSGPSTLLKTPTGEALLRFASQLGLAALWESWGVAPGACVGEGIGAVAAGLASGRLGTAEAAQFVADHATQGSGEGFLDEVARLASDGYDTYIEIGADPATAEKLRTALAERQGSARVHSSLRPGDRELESMRWSAASLYASGFELDWSQVFPSGRFVRLPNYPWRRQRYWLDQEASPPRSARSDEAIAEPRLTHPATGSNGHDGSAASALRAPSTLARANGHGAATEDSIAAHAEAPTALAVPSLGRPDLVDYLRERTATLLGLAPDQIELDRPLMALGLDSIFAMELKLDLDEFLGAPLPLSVLIEGSSIRDVARRAHQAMVESQVGATSPSSDPAQSRDLTSSGPRPSPGQRLLWYAHQFAPTGAAYHIAGAGVVRTDLDLGALRRAIRRVIARHDALRSTFPAVDEAPALRILEVDELSAREDQWFLVEEASALDDDAITARLTELVRRPFDLENGPHFRLHLLTRPDSEHVVLVVFHHIVSDFLSAAVFLDDLGRAYGEEVSGKVRAWPPAQSFIDFVRQQDERLAGEEGERLWTYWQSQLAGPLPVLDLPTDRPRSAFRSDRGRMHQDVLDPELTQAIVAMCERLGTSLYATLLAAFQVFLARWAGQEDVIVGSPVAMRNRPGLEGMVGYLVNMLPMRASVADDPYFEEFLTRVRRTVAEGLEHQDFPFSTMVERLQVGADAGRSPIFQVMYAHQRSQRLDEQGLAPFALGIPGARLDLHGISVESVALDRQAALFELALMTARDGDRLRLTWEYSTDLFTDATAECMAAGFRTLLAAIAADSAQKVSALPALSAEERNRVLEWWSIGPELTHEDSAIHERFEREVLAAPDATALVFGDESLTYGELNRLANVVARDLIDRGVGPERVVGIYVERWPLRVIGLLGILKAGAAYLPLDPEHPLERLASTLRDSGTNILLTENSLRERLPLCEIETIAFVDRLVDSQPADDPGNPCVPANADSVAYVIFTSGTTGRPKGVMVHHHALLAVASAWERLYDLRGATRTHLQAAGFAFDVFTGDWVRALTTGGTLVACPRGVLLDPPALADLIRRERIEFLELVPAIADALATHLEAQNLDLAGLRLLAVGSDTLRGRLYKRLRRLMGPEGRVLNSYGLTETAIDSTCFAGSAQAMADEGQVPIGQPLPGVRAYVLDRWGDPVPAGVVGELHIGGAGVARGYVNMPGLTAVRFLPDPLGPPGSRMYATGDRARWRAGGVLELLGRHDAQVKVRGFRVELSEVEAVLVSHPDLSEAAVVVHQDHRGEMRLAAYVVSSIATSTTALELRHWLKERLPGPMVPSSFAFLKELPRSHNGKLDRSALVPLAMLSGDESLADYVAPRTIVEEILAGITADLTGRERVSVNDDFFDMGIDSIIGIQLVSRARQAGLHLEPTQLFRYPSVAELAAAVEAGPVSREHGKSLAPVSQPFGLIPEGVDPEEVRRTFAERGGIEDLFPLTPVQAGMLYHTVADPEAGCYVEQFVCRLRGELDITILRESSQELVARHSALRTTIHQSALGTPYQVVHRHANEPLDYRDWRALPEIEQEQQLAAFLELDRRKGFVPSQPPLSRMALFRLGEDLHQLVWSIHHVVVDGWCLSVLLHEMLDNYDAIRRGLPPESKTCRPFRDYVAWLRDRDDIESAKYWRKELRGFTEPTPLGLDGLNADQSCNDSLKAADCEIALDRAEFSALQQLGRSRRLTLSTLIQGAWALLLARYSGRSEVVFGVTVAGRPPELAGVETMIGMFINVLPLRVAVDESAPLVPWLLGLQERLLDLRRFESVPLASVRGWGEIPAGQPLFESIVTVQNLPFVESLRERADRLGIESPQYLERTHYPITVTVVPDTELRIKIGFDATRFAPDAMKRVLGHVRTLLISMATNAGVQIADLPWSLDGEGESLPEQWARPADDSWLPELADLERLDEGELDALLDQLG